MTEAKDAGKLDSKSAPVPQSGYVVSVDDVDPVTRDWLSSLGVLKNEDVAVRLVAITQHFDGIEVWQDTIDWMNDCETSDRILAVSHFPITRGDVRKLCWALNVRCG